jgi:hypothetical protein
MENKPTSIEVLFNKVKEYIDTTVELYKLKSIKKVAGFFSTFSVSIILFLLSFMIILFISIGFALLIGAWLGKMYFGFFVMGGIYIIIGLVLYSRRKKSVRRVISDRLIKELFDDE